MIQWMLVIWFLVPLLFLNSICTSRSFQFMYWWNLAWRILSIILLACEMSATVQQFVHSLVLPFLWDWNENFFQSCGYCWVSQICWHTECGTLTASSFGIWNSSAGIPSPPLAFFKVMLPKAHLTSHSRMSGSRVFINIYLTLVKVYYAYLRRNGLTVMDRIVSPQNSYAKALIPNVTMKLGL